MRKVKEKGPAVGVLSFEVVALMSEVAHLWHALSDARIASLRQEALRLEGVRRLVSDDDGFLLRLVVSEYSDKVASLARSIARLSRRCSDPILRRFQAAFADLVKNGADGSGFEYAAGKMDRKVRKMERFVAVGAKLFKELEVLDKNERNLRLILANPSRHAGVAGVRNKVESQQQQVKCLREASLWVRTFDYVVRLLARSLFSVVGRLRQVFGYHSKNEAAEWPDGSSAAPMFSYGNSRAFAGQCLPSRSKWPPRGSGAFVETSPELPLRCISLPGTCQIKENTTTPLLIHASSSHRDTVSRKLAMSMIEPGFRRRPNSRAAATLGVAALALHYANVIMTIENLAASSHSIDPDERDGLYGMLTTSLRSALRDRLKPKTKAKASDSSSSFCDPVLAEEWRSAMARTLQWLAPLAHNMMKWQEDRSFEQQGPARRSNVLLLQTLHFANREKTEDAITELLVGLDYLWRYGRDHPSRDDDV